MNSQKKQQSARKKKKQNRVKFLQVNKPDTKKKPRRESPKNNKTNTRSNLESKLFRGITTSTNRSNWTKKTLILNTMKGKNPSKRSRILVEDEDFNPEAKYPSNSTAKFFNTLVKNCENFPRFSLLGAEIMTYVFLTSLVFSNEISGVLREENRLHKFLREGSVFNKIGSFLSLRNLVSKLSTLGIFMFYGIILILFFSFYLIFWKYYEIQKILKKSKIDQPVKFSTKKKIIRFISFILLNYDLIFLIVNCFCIETFFCQSITQKISILSDSSSNFQYLQQSGISNEYLKMKKQENQISSELRTIKVSYVNTDIGCYTANHSILIFKGVLILFLNFSLKSISSKIASFFPNPKILKSKYGNSDYISEVLFFILTIAKTCHIALKLENKIYDYYSYISFGLIIGVYWIATKSRNYYCDMANSLKSFKVLYLGILTSIMIILRNITLSEQESEKEFPLVFFTFLLIALFAKANHNYHASSIKTLIESTENMRSITSFHILRIAYRILQFCDFEIKNHYKEKKKDMCSFNKESRVMINWMMDKHSSRCYKLECFCKNSKVFKFKNPLIKFDVLDKNKEVFRCMFLLELLFENFVRNNKRRFDKEILICYYHILLNYLGKITTVHCKIHGHLAEMKYFKKKKVDDKTTILEFDAILEQINSLSRENMEMSSLVMRDYKNEMKEILEFENKNKTKNAMRVKFRINVMKHVKYLHSFQETKRLVGIASQLKYKFLKGMSELHFSVEELVNISEKFCRLKKMIYQRFNDLMNISKKKYSPLFNIFGHFALEICEDVKIGNTLLQKFEKCYSRMDLNQVFGTVENARYELVAMYVNAEKSSNLQKIIYTTSNVRKWLVGKELDLLLPDPIKSYHKKLFALNSAKGGGNLFMHQMSRSLIIKTKKGHLVPFEFGVRMNINQSNMIEFVGLLNFRKNDMDSCVVLLNKEGCITGVTQSAAKIFEEGTYLGEYNKEFENINESFNRIAEERVQRIELKENYSELLEDRERIRAWFKYSNWVRRQTINILDKNKKVKRIVCRFENYIVYQRNNYFRFLILEEANNEVYSRFFSKLEIGETKEENVIRSMKNYYDEIKNLPELEEDEDEFFEDFSDEEEGKLKAEKKKEITTMRELKHRIWLENRKFAVGEENPNITFPKEFGGGRKFISHVSDITGTVNVKSKINDSGTTKKMVQIKEESIIEEFPIIKKPTLHRKKKRRKTTKFGLDQKIIEKMKKEKHEIEEFNSERSSILRQGKVGDTLALLFNKVKGRKKRIFRIFVTTLMLMELIFTTVVLISEKGALSELTKEIKNHSYELEVFKEFQSALIYPLFYTEILRMVNEGWIDQNSNTAKELTLNLSNQSLKEFAQSKLQSKNPYLIFYDNLIDMNIRGIEIDGLFNEDVWIYQEINVVEFDEETSKYTQNNFARRSALKKLQAISKKIFSRNYTDSEGYVKVKTPSKIDLDHLEHVFRLNILQDFSQNYRHSQTEFENYLDLLMEKGQELNNLELALSIILSLLLMTISYIFYIIKLKEFKGLYRLVFDIKVTKIFFKIFFQEQHLGIVLEWYKTKIDLIGDMLKDELNYERNMKRFFEAEKSAKKEIQEENIKKQTVDKIKLKHDGYYFGLRKLIWVFVLTFFSLIFIQFSFYLLVKPNWNKAGNLLQVFSLGSEIFSSYSIMNVFMIETVLYNNSLKGWNSGSTYDSFQEVKTHITKHLLPKYIAILDQDVGSLKDKMEYTLTRGNSCETVFSKFESHENCNMYFDGVFSSNLMNSLRGMVTVTERVMQEWKSSDKDWEKTKGILGQKNMITIYNKLEDIISSVYYWAVGDSSDSMNKELDELLGMMGDFWVLILFIEICACVFGACYLFSHAEGMMEKNYSVFMVLPLVLVKENMVLVHRLQKIKRENSFF